MQGTKNALRVFALGAFYMGRTLVGHIFMGRIFPPVALLLSILIPGLPTHGRVLDCVPKGMVQVVTVAHVYDGDTVRLEDGRRVRLLSINTPELGLDGAPNQKFARQAKNAVEDFLAIDGKTLIYTDIETQDKYHRYLAHIYKQQSDGSVLSLERDLLIKGLAYHVVIPPNIALAECLAKAEEIAQWHKRGLWADTKAATLRAGQHRDVSIKGGYQRISGEVMRVTLKKAWWINFSSGLTAVIYPENQQYFDRNRVAKWQGRTFEIEGWVYKSSYKGKPQWRIRLETLYAITELPLSRH